MSDNMEIWSSSICDNCDRIDCTIVYEENKMTGQIVCCSCYRIDCTTVYEENKMTGQIVYCQ